MRTPRRLALRRETLTELRSDDLARLAGAAQALPSLAATATATATDPTGAWEDELWCLSLHQHCTWTCI